MRGASCTPRDRQHIYVYIRRSGHGDRSILSLCHPARESPHKAKCQTLSDGLRSYRVTPVLHYCARVTLMVPCTCKSLTRVRSVVRGQGSRAVSGAACVLESHNHLSTSYLVLSCRNDAKNVASSYMGNSKFMNSHRGSESCIIHEFTNALNLVCL